jgi:hypothetical protein
MSGEFTSRIPCGLSAKPDCECGSDPRCARCGHTLNDHRTPGSECIAYCSCGTFLRDADGTTGTTHYPGCWHSDSRHWLCAVERIHYLETRLASVKSEAEPKP